MSEQPQVQIGERDYYLGKAVLLASVAALGGFLFGFDTAVINGAVNAMREDFDMGSGLTGFVVSSALAGLSGRPRARELP